MLTKEKSARRKMVRWSIKPVNVLFVMVVLCLGLVGPSVAVADMEVTSSGDVGIGTSSPVASLEVRRSNGSATIKVDENSGTVNKRQMFILENNGGVSFRFIDRSANRIWTFATTDNPPVGEFVLNDPVSPGREFFLDGDGNGIFKGDVTATSFIQSSDRHLKDNVEPLDSREVLVKVMKLPISSWNLKTGKTKDRHVGPMAQDFYAAFGLGPDERHITPLDAAGVALAAIQEIVRVKDAQIADLEKRLSVLEQTLNRLTQTAPLVYLTD
jgi:hypothetical protein